MALLTEPVHAGLHRIRASEPFTHLRESLEGMGQRLPLIYVPNTGNWGDSLINNGARAFLAQLSHPYAEATQRQVLESRGSSFEAALIVAGNGGWCRHWSHIPEFVEAACEMFREVVLLPTTIDTAPLFVPRENLTAFVRDDTLSLANAPSATFCHDLAFLLPIFAEMRESRPRALHAFRLDGESARGNFDLPATNLDWSLFGTHEDDPLLFLEFMAGFSQVLTDRLHVAIGAAMLGREVHLWPNDYGKIRAIYQSSLKPYFNNVTLHEWGAGA